MAAASRLTRALLVARPRIALAIRPTTAGVLEFNQYFSTGETEVFIGISAQRPLRPLSIAIRSRNFDSIVMFAFIL